MAFLVKKCNKNLRDRARDGFCAHGDTVKWRVNSDHRRHAVRPSFAVVERWTVGRFGLVSVVGGQFRADGRNLLAEYCLICSFDAGFSMGRKPKDKAGRARTVKINCV